MTRLSCTIRPLAALALALASCAAEPDPPPPLELAAEELNALDLWEESYYASPSNEGCDGIGGAELIRLARESRSLGAPGGAPYVMFARHALVVRESPAESPCDAPLGVISTGHAVELIDHHLVPAPIGTLVWVFVREITDGSAPLAGWVPGGVEDLASCTLDPWPAP